eukprot:11156382-Lingulodinium_polyedra.AAC.1
MKCARALKRAHRARNRPRANSTPTSYKRHTRSQARATHQHTRIQHRGTPRRATPYRVVSRRVVSCCIASRAVLEVKHDISGRRSWKS